MVPLFYERDADGLPRGWIAMMKQSIRILAPTFSGVRMVKQYVERFYLPAGEHYRRLEADGFARARELTAWKTRVREAWPDVKVAGAMDMISGIFRSTNGGRAWRELEFSPDWAPVLSLALSPGFGADGMLFAGNTKGYTKD